MALVSAAIGELAVVESTVARGGDVRIVGRWRTVPAPVSVCGEIVVAAGVTTGLATKETSTVSGGDGDSHWLIGSTGPRACGCRAVTAYTIAIAKPCTSKALDQAIKPRFTSMRWT